MPDFDHLDRDADRSGGRDTGPNAPVETPSGGRATAVTVAVGVVIGITIAALVLWLSARGDKGTPATAPLTESVPGAEDGGGASNPGQPAIDPVDLVVAYGRSRTEDHAVVGQLRRTGQDAIPVRRAILGERSIDEAGATAAVTENGETRQCERIDDQWLCAPPLPAISSDVDVRGFASLLLTESPPYSIFAVSAEPPPDLDTITELGPSTCWSMVSAERRDRARFGAETTLCFHDEIGALIGRITETSNGIDLFVATDLRGQVTVADVEPSR